MRVSRVQESRSSRQEGRTGRRIEAVFLVLLAGAACAALLPNLQDHYLWQDEAQTALVGRTVMARGLPYGTDGKNFFSQEQGAEYGRDHLWKWHTWLPFYLVAGSFELLGVGTFAARLPFALFGVATVLLLYGFVVELCRDRRAAGAAAILLLGCVPFLLLSRQCRYYSPAAFFALLGLWSYLRMLNRRRLSRSLFILAGVLLFHAQHIYTAPLLAAAFLHCVLFHREAWRRVGLACAGTLLLCLPWILWLSGARFGERFGGVIGDAGLAFTKAIGFGRKIFRHVFPAFLILVPLASWLAGRVRKRPVRRGSESPGSVLALPLIFAGVTLLVLSLTSPAPFFRYLSPVIPPLLAVAGMLVVSAWEIYPFVGALALAAALALQPIPDFVFELTHDYEGPIEGIVRHLDEEASAGDVVAITYGDMPLKFYTDLRVVGGLTGEDPRPALTADWIIIRSYAITTTDRRFSQWLTRNVDPARYRVVTLPQVDTRFENREEPNEHRFHTATEGPRVTMLQRADP